MGLGPQALLFFLQAQLHALNIGQALVGLLGSGGHHDFFLLGQVRQLLIHLVEAGQGLVVEIYVGAGLVDKVDGFVGEIAVGDIPLAHGDSKAAHGGGDGYLMEGLVIGGDALNHLDAVLNGGLLHDNGLEPPLQGGVLLNMLTVFVKGCRADYLEFAPAEGGLEDVGGVHGAFGVAGTHNGVDLVNNQNDIAQLFDFFNEALHAALKLAPELGARYQGGEVQQIDLLVRQLVGHVPVGDALGQALGDGGLAYAGFADEAGVVFLAAVQNLDHPFQFTFPADQLIQLALLCPLGQGDAVAVQEFPFGGLGGIFFTAGGRGRGALAGGGGRGGGAAAEKLVEEGERGGAAVVLLVVFVLGGGHHAVDALGAAKGGHHFRGEVIQILIADTHFLHHVINGLDAHLPGAFEAQPLVFGGAALQFCNEDNRHIFAAAAAHGRLHS